jgi:RND family efflux transporter MFP subunit
MKTRKNHHFTILSFMKMKITFQIFVAVSMLLLLWSCGGKSVNGEDPVAQLAALKEQRSALETQIATLEKDLEAQGLIERKLRTIAVTEVKTEPFNHYIDLQGKVEADESVAATSKIPGALKKVHIDNGDFVRKGQLLAEIDDAVLLKNIAELEGQLAVAEDLYNRQKSLWEQQIGSEVQFIQARNNKETLERSIATAKENWGMTKIYAPTTGTVDMVVLKQGEAIAPGIPLCHILNMEKLLIKGEVTEAYAAVVKKGDVVKARFPDTDKEITTKVTYVSKSINPVNRTFTVECQLGNGDYRANQIAVLRIVDYQNPKAVTIPVNLIQTDDQGDYVLIVENKGTPGQGEVKKIPVNQGRNYSGHVEINSGLQPGHLLITTGFQDVSAGETVLY